MCRPAVFGGVLRTRMTGAVAAQSLLERSPGAWRCSNRGDRPFRTLTIRSGETQKSLTGPEQLDLPEVS